MNRNRNLFQLVNRKYVVSHSKEDANEAKTEIILKETLLIRSDTYKTKWLVSDCSYDVLLVIPWHVKFKPKVRYKKRDVRVNSARKSIESSAKTEEKASSNKMTNLSVKTFCQVLTQKSPSNFKVFQFFTKGPMKDRSKKRKLGIRLYKLLRKLESMF